MKKIVYKSVENRQHQRKTFAPGEKPILTIDGKQYIVDDISQGGIKFQTPIDDTIGKDISGTLSFPDGESIDINGNIVWKGEDVAGMSFYNPLSEDVISRDNQVAFLKTEFSIPTFRKQSDPKNDGYTHQHLVKLGIKQKRLKKWLASRYIGLGEKENDTNDSPKRFRRFDLYIMKLFDYLVDQGYAEEEVALRMKILTLAEKKSDSHFYKKEFIGLSNRIDFTKIPHDMREKMWNWLSNDYSLSQNEEKKVKIYLKYLVPVLLEMSHKNLIIPAALYQDCQYIFIINYKKIRDQVDEVIDS